MNTVNQIKKNGYIYGVSSVYNFGWTHRVFKFTSIEGAEKWLHTETFCFAERELCSKIKAITLAGHRAIKYAPEAYFIDDDMYLCCTQPDFI